MRTTVSGHMKLRAGAAARSRSSAWVASATASAMRTIQRPRPRSAHPSGTGLTAPNITTTIAAGIGPSSSLHKTALHPFNVRAAADTPRESPCGSVVRTPPKAGQVPRDDLRRHGVDRPAIVYERARGFHEDCICLFLPDLTRVLPFFSGLPSPFLIRLITSLFPSFDPRLCIELRDHIVTLSVPVVTPGPRIGHVRLHWHDVISWRVMITISSCSGIHVFRCIRIHALLQQKDSNRASPFGLGRKSTL